jgi:hypothetical protein
MWARLFLEVPTWSHPSYGRLWNSVVSLPFLVMAYWESLTNWSLAVNLDNLVASILFPSSQVEMVEVENFLEQSRFSNSQHGKVILRVFVLGCAHNPQVLRIEQESTPRIDRSFRLRSSVSLSQAWSIVHRVFLISLPITVDYLDRWAHRHQYHGHTTPWRRSAFDFRNRIHDAVIAWADLVELRVVHTRYPTGTTDRYSPVSAIKWNLLPRTADTKAPFPSSSAVSLFLFFF